MHDSRIVVYAFIYQMHLMLVLSIVIGPICLVCRYLGMDLGAVAPWIFVPFFIIWIIGSWWAARNRVVYGADFSGGYRMIWIELRLLLSFAIGKSRLTPPTEGHDDSS